MRSLGIGVLVGIAIGIFIGVVIARFADTARAVGLGFGAGVGIFAVGAIVRVVAGLVDGESSKLKEGKQP